MTFNNVNMNSCKLKNKLNFTFLKNNHPDEKNSFCNFRHFYDDYFV